MFPGLSDWGLFTTSNEIRLYSCSKFDDPSEVYEVSKLTTDTFGAVVNEVFLELQSLLQH